MDYFSKVYKAVEITEKEYDRLRKSKLKEGDYYDRSRQVKL